ncbi:hypothetical protein BN8_00932 [Fibrisoma limi BUZ 3]|uniref:DUF3575 domain-containing protein n=1 Tax=Fibrisoma limi BUZ 3 TaxID=1185876 RepID=I2GDJ7_9BACT|nr:hypothetical protein [Fibrisoma limi]CCH51971.1 hypothetical protein BN8_00932 [Fibrisoma limi BUZ 3]
MIKSRYILLAALLITLATIGTATAQDSTVSLRRPVRAVIKLAPLALVDQDATLQAGLEYRTGQRTSVQAEFGYGWKGLSLLEADLEDFEKAEVWRARSEVRFYTNRYRTNRRKEIAVKSSFPLGNYWAIEGFAKQINVTKNEYSYQPIEASSAPRYLGQMSISRYVAGTHVKIGRQFAFYDPYRRTFSRTLFDIYLGAGVRWAINDVRRNSPTSMGMDCGCGPGRSFETEGSQWTPSLTAGLKVGFGL